MFKYLRSLFFWFFLDEKESLKGITVFVGRLAGCLHTSRITTNGVNTLTSVSFSARLRLSKSKTELAPVMPSVSRLDKVKGFQGFGRIRMVIGLRMKDYGLRIDGRIEGLKDLCELQKL